MSIASRVADLQAGTARLLALPTGVRDVVSFRGSFLSAPDFASDDDVTQGLVTDLIDKGSATRDRFEIADLLDGRGARLSFYSDGLRMGFAGRCLRDDLPDVLALASELYLTPAFDPDEVQKAQQKAVASVRRSRESTGARANGAFTRRLYPPTHPNHTLRASTEIEQLEAVTPETARAYHGAHVGTEELTLVAVGDVEPGALAATVTEAFRGWAPHGREASFARTAQPQPPGRETVEMADKLNLDVRMGHAVPLRRDSADFLALFAGVFVLGGNFSARLMQTVRDEQGLTYGVGARLAGPAVEHDMDLRVSISLSQENLERGIAATREQIERWAGGITAEELERAKTTLAGQHVVGLATTGGLAARLLVYAERGFGPGYLDRYPEEIRALTVDEVNAAIARYVQPDALHVVAAGTAA
ncbi:MAG TPA: insulinase family protein [Bacteroidetes bacterium]|nr:insulinase family protein [Bacteroidota bacterium]HIL56936.1 insulinase family protein [Rhodothermales bacterium]